LPTSGAEHAANCIVGTPEGEAPPGWKSEKPGEFEIVPAEEKTLNLENFEITIIRKSNGEKYTWKPSPDLFSEGYFEYWDKERRGEKLKWWEETRWGEIKGKPIDKLEESIGKVLSNEIHDKYAHHLDVYIVGKVSDEGTILYLAAELAKTGDKKELEKLREKLNEASENIDGFHDLVHHRLVPIAEEMGKGIHEANNLHDLGHKLMASIYRLGGHLDEIEMLNNVDKIKKKAIEMLDEVKKLKGFAGEAHIHSTDPASVLTMQKPLKLRDGGKVIEIKYEELGEYHGEMAGKGESTGVPAGPISFGIIMVGLIAIGFVRWRRARALKSLESNQKERRD
ncbi:hypothetical protein KAU04_03505, partial [bacterium]|nr:hypothetical protein [bacterium]